MLVVSAHLIPSLKPEDEPSQRGITTKENAKQPKKKKQQQQWFTPMPESQR